MNASQSKPHRTHMRAALIRLFGRPCLKQYLLWSMAFAALCAIFACLWLLIPILPKATLSCVDAGRPLAISRDGTILLTAASPSEDCDAVKVWNLVTGQQRLAIVGSFVREVHLSPDDAVFTVVDHEYRLSLWETATGEQCEGFLELRKNPFWAPGRKMDLEFKDQFSPDGRFLILERLLPHALVFWDVERRAVRGKIDGSLSKLTIAEDAKQLAVCRPGQPGQFRIERWQLDADFPDAGPFQVHQLEADAVAVSPNFDSFASQRVSHDPTGADEIQLWDLDTGEEKAKALFFNSQKPRCDLRFSPKGHFLTADDPFDLYGEDGEPLSHTLWNAQAGLKDVGRNLAVWRFSPDDRWLLVQTKSDEVDLFDAVMFQKRGTLSVSGDVCLDAIFSYRPYRRHSNCAGRYHFAPNSKTVFVGGLMHPDDRNNPVTDFLGRYIPAFPGTDPRPSVVRVWDVESGKEIETFWDSSLQLSSANGRTLVTTNIDGTITVWDVPTRKPVILIACLSLVLWLSIVTGIQLLQRLIAWWFAAKQMTPKHQ